MEFLEKLSIQLQPYKEIVGGFATVVSTLRLLAPAVILYKVRSTGSTKGVSFLPFVGTFVISTLYLLFGQLNNDATLTKVHSIGSLIGLSYLLIYLYFTLPADRPDVIKKIAYGFTLIAACYLYTKIGGDPEVIRTRYSKFLTILLFTFIASPFIHLKEVIRTKNTDKLPFPMIFVGAIVAVSWLLYAVIINNIYMIAQTLVMALMFSFQLSLFVIYPSKSKNE